MPSEYDYFLVMFNHHVKKSYAVYIAQYYSYMILMYAFYWTTLFSIEGLEGKQFP